MMNITSYKVYGKEIKGKDLPGGVNWRLMRKEVGVLQ